jgi:hypothetical protein
LRPKALSVYMAQQGSQVIDQHPQMIEQIAQSHNVASGKGRNNGAGQ